MMNMDGLKKHWKYYASVFGVSSAFMAFFYVYKKYNSKALNCKDLHFNLYPLLKEDAEARSEIISNENLNYTLFLHLKDKNSMNSEFEGSVLIEFTLKKVDSLFIDFHGEIQKITVNGKEIPISYSKDRINLQASQLSTQNKVLIEFKCLYSNNEHGLRYMKSDDFETYITSNFEPFYAHTAFPCFNQLDLKANIKLFVATHKEYDVISTGI
jgi:aminopeptidase N